MKGSKNIRGSTELEKQFIDIFNQLCNRHHAWQVWQDFINMSACAIANAVDRRPEVWKQREDSYMKMVKKYSKDELNLISELLAITTLALDENSAQDFLGEFYMQLDFGSDWHGQFFTPWHIAELMAKMQLDEKVKEQISSKGYISVNDSCCGSGCMLMAFANVCKDMDINYQQSVFFVGQDIDDVVAKICYIQISLLGCSGYVVIGNSLLEPICGSAIEPSYKEPENIWFTPLYFNDIWTLHRIKSRKKDIQEESENKPILLPKKELSKEKITGLSKTVTTANKQSQTSVAKKQTSKKKQFSWKEFFTMKGKGKK